ncbi:hypothetical protein [Dongia deserti]|uniref:hypothetical protein n=1 Tax=Dongia deserti TaxID=2268030 RepID=UPI000E65B57A|nr:hypothetical protein [Dongia deserti]
MSTSVHTRVADTTLLRRSPAEVMRLTRMGCSHPTRLSFLRCLLRRMQDEHWRFDRPVWNLDHKGVGHAVYRAIGPVRTYSLVAFGHDLPDEQRSDRVIATAWDATFALFDGTRAPSDVSRLAANVPLQEAGRITASELTLSRANQSVRVFSHVVDSLAQGRQPNQRELDSVGYLMRTTAVYGSGKFGAADRARICERPELRAPFQAEMLTVWLIRAFTVDLVEHLAQARGGTTAAKLDRSLRRRLGVGNATGLGMAPFLIRHPALLNNWVMAREEALARVRALPGAGRRECAHFEAALERARENAALWSSAHPIQVAKLHSLRADLARLSGYIADGWDRRAANAWDALWRWANVQLSTEGQEQLLALVIEPHGALVDDLAESMHVDEDASFTIDGSMAVGTIRNCMAEIYDTPLRLDYAQPENTARFWYVSEDKLEPRLGERFEEAGAEREQPLDIGRQAQSLHEALKHWDVHAPIAAFLLAHPEFRYMIRRVQIARTHPYAEIRDNLISADMLPIDLLRCKLAFFGATRFDPRSDRWVRISLFQGAPFPDELADSVE